MLAEIPNVEGSPLQVVRLKIQARIKSFADLMAVMEDGGKKTLRGKITELQFCLREIDFALSAGQHPTSMLQTGSDVPTCLPERTHAMAFNTPETDKAQCKHCRWVRDMTKGEKISEGKRKAADARREAGQYVPSPDAFRVDREEFLAAVKEEDASERRRSAGRFIPLAEALELVDTASKHEETDGDN